MRLLHTSDWHLGRSFHREDLLSAQARFVDFLVDTVRAEGVDAVLVSGDVYDRALPPVDAVALCDDALRRLAGTGAAGRPDQRQPRLGPPARLRLGADRRGGHPPAHRRRPAAHRPVLLADQDGPVAVYALPYLEPDAVRAELGCDDRSHAARARRGHGPGPRRPGRPAGQPGRSCSRTRS